MTGRHQGSKQKLRVGYRALQQIGWLMSVITEMDVTCCDVFSSLSACFLCAMHVFEVRASSSVIFVLIYFLVLVLVFQLFFPFSFHHVFVLVLVLPTTK